MVAKIRSQLQWSSPPEFTSSYDNLLVSGCSYVWNNSEQHVCTWPYYLQKLIGCDQVLDCSQSGSGSNHIFNSIINEIETNSNITPENTLVLVMWSGLERVDVVAEHVITKNWHHMSNYRFDDQHSTLSIFRNKCDDSNPVSELCGQYSKIVSPGSQMYESYIKIIALDHYLNHRGFRYLFLNWEDVDQQFDKSLPLYPQARSLISSVKTLGEFADSRNMRIPNDGHPDTECHLQWCREILIPYLQSLNLVD